MRIATRVERVVKFEAAKLIAQFFYFTGLTLLIPLVPLLLSPHELVNAKYAFGLAVFLIVFGFFVVYLFSHSRRTALRVLGMTTLIPGLLAVFFSYAGARRQALFLSWFGEVTPLLERWLETHMPTTWLLAGVYIILGVILIWLSEKGRR